MKKQYSNKNQKSGKTKQNPEPSVKKTEKPKVQKTYGEMLKDARKPDKK